MNKTMKPIIRKMSIDQIEDMIEHIKQCSPNVNQEELHDDLMQVTIEIINQSTISKFFIYMAMVCYIELSQQKIIKKITFI